MAKNPYTSYLEIAEIMSKRSTCLHEQYGVIIVKDDTIIATGYNGVPSTDIHGFTSNEKNCLDTNICSKPCSNISAELNAILSSDTSKLKGSIMFLFGRNTATGDYCYTTLGDSLTKRIIKKVGITCVIVKITDTRYKVFNTEDFEYIEEQTIVNYNDAKLIEEKVEFARDRVAYINTYVGAMTTSNLVSLAFNRVPEPEEYVKAINDYFNTFGKKRIKIHYNGEKFLTEDGIELQIAVAGESAYYLLKKKEGVKDGRKS